MPLPISLPMTSAPPPAAAPRVTLVMTLRERHQPTMAAIASLLAETPPPYRLIFAEVQSPPWLHAELAAASREHGFELRRFDQPLWPQQVRAALIDEIDSEYVVFVDNDLAFYPGWLERLVECADQTGAGIVGPMYLWGDDHAAPKVHMSGGDLSFVEEDGARVLEDRHRHYNADPDTAAAEGRRACDFVEFHCMLLRTELARQPGVIDGRIGCVHEHIDIALTAKERGYGIYVEPASRVLYRAFIPTMLEDLALMRRRWSPAAMEDSIATFCAKWRVLPDDRSFGTLRQYVKGILTRTDPLRQGRRHDDLDQAMDAAALAQNRSALLDLARARGYDDAQVELLSRSCRLATALVREGYRPCGRPFINHLIGTAAVLLRYDFRLDLVLAGLLHAAYSHGLPPQGDGPQALAQIEELLGGRDSVVEQRVRAWSLRAAPGQAAPQQMSAMDGELAAMAGANEIDMRLAGEYAYSGRPDEIDAAGIGHIADSMRRLGAPGLAQTLEQAVAARPAVDPALQTGIHASFRLGPELSLLPMARRLAAAPSNNA
ncbi:MAG TPA: glycosyltransferase [Rhodocyclaceae bacterium]